MSEDTYTCAVCGETFEKGWTDEEALSEATELYGEIPPEERAVICDVCYKSMMIRYN